MCILIHHTKNTVFTDDQLADFYQHNPDGFGVMYGDGKIIHVHKTLGNLEEVKALYNSVAVGRECMIHFRMQTHGDIDINNCHPYKVNDDIYMAHNGILSAGNPIYKQMSDTWHIIEYIIKPIAENNPDLLFSDEWIDYMEEVIGKGNKFGFCHADGRTSIINKSAGVHLGEAWMSNTYAWSAHKYGVGSKVLNAYSGWDYDYDYGWTGQVARKGVVQASAKKSALYVPPKEVAFDTSPKYNLRKVESAAFNSWKRGHSQLLDWVHQAPEKAKFLLSNYYTWYDDELNELVNADPEYAADCIAEMFETSSTEYVYN